MDGEYKEFSDFVDPTDAKRLDGDKIKITDVLDHRILITGFRISKSKYEKSNSEDCLTLQFILNGHARVIFSGSSVLMEQLNKYEGNIPFYTTIKKIDRYYTLT